MKASDLRDLDAERAVLGAIMLTPEIVDDVAEVVSPADFSREQYELVFAAMIEMASRLEPIDIVTLADVLRRNGNFERAGGLGVLGELDVYVPSSGNWARYANPVRDLAMRRRLIDAALRTVEAAGDVTLPVMDVIGRAEADVQGAADRVVGTKIMEPLSAKVGRAFKGLEALYERKEDVTGAPSGLAALDIITAGFQPTDLVILAGRPAMGKTAALVGWLLNIARTKGPVALFELEMNDAQLVNRLLSAEGRVDAGRMRTGKMLQSDWPKLSNAASAIYQAPLFIDDTSNASIAEIRAKCRRLKARHGQLAAIGVDYIQLMRSIGNASNREQEVSEFARGLKFLAKEFGCPVIGLSQLNRELEKRADKRPILSDLRESGSLEQEADVVLFVYRDEVYNKETQDKGIAEIIVAKQRNGGVGTARVAFVKEFTLFENLAGDRDGAPQWNNRD